MSPWPSGCGRPAPSTGEAPEPASAINAEQSGAGRIVTASANQAACAALRGPALPAPRRRSRTSSPVRTPHRTGTTEIPSFLPAAPCRQRVMGSIGRSVPDPQGREQPGTRRRTAGGGAGCIVRRGAAIHAPAVHLELVGAALASGCLPRPDLSGCRAGRPRARRHRVRRARRPSRRTRDLEREQVALADAHVPRVALLHDDRPGRQRVAVLIVGEHGDDLVERRGVGRLAALDAGARGLVRGDDPPEAARRPSRSRRRGRGRRRPRVRRVGPPRGAGPARSATRACPRLGSLPLSGVRASRCVVRRQPELGARCLYSFRVFS